MKAANWSSIWGRHELIMHILGEKQKRGDGVTRGVEVMKEEKADSIRLIKILEAEIQACTITRGKEMQWQHQVPEHPTAKVRVVNVNPAEEV
jgi:hypothetical protein